ncbi:disease resistance protein RPV1 [Lactuca sativa]|uniref:disease resistance protein RPV1 n=1 Tax=Lactuca sativa TaxID=4236 RepID=UPI001C68CC8D|nr:disease resistance protein RPV1 [Lactuca sativa]
MASSSTSSVDKSFKYDVFLSFRGEDTRTNFIDHLYHALQNKSIHTYKDDEKIKKGKNISDELIGSIEDSKFYIIVFSKNYASSSWCLDELVKIMECQRTNEHTAYPVFYDVEPSEVRKQSGPVVEAFAKHEKEEAAGKWREALKESADLSGWELKKTADGHEAKFINRIVEEISLELRSISFNIDEKLCPNDRYQGDGGGGKTTLARAVFDHISFRFEGKSFVENVRENASLSSLKSLQKQVIADVFNEDLRVSSVSDGKHMMKRRLRDKKVLVVLDDVDHINQFEVLAGEPNWFKAGSVIIITTRDEQVLVAHGVKFIHDVNLLSDKEAICLFNRFAFGRDIPIQGYEELSRKVVLYAAGLPLTITVLGSFLCGKDELEWIDALERLKTIPETETLKKLELSYTCLEEDYKEIFLDVACIMKGWQKDDAIKALKSCGFHARNGLRVLQQKSLITINYDYLGMHDHIVEMGRNIVRRWLPNKPHKHSRLWKIDEIKDILANDLGTKATRCIRFHSKKFNPHIFIKGLRKMKELRFLSVSGDCSSDYEFGILGPDFPNALRYLHWTSYPFRSLPTAFQASNLKIMVLNKLKFLDLSCSMLRTLDLGLAPNLEELILVECTYLEKLHLPGRCLNLRCLILPGSSLRTLDIGLTPNLEKLDLKKSYCLEELHMGSECQKVTELIISHLNLRTLDLGMTPNLKKLHLKECRKLEKLHTPIGCLKKLVQGDLSGCLRFGSFRFNIEDNTSCSVDESLEVGPLAELHLFVESIERCLLHPDNNLPKFRFDCDYKEDRPSLTRNLEILFSVGMCACTNLEMFSQSICGLQRLRKLELKGSFVEAIKDLDQLESLEELILLSTNINHLPDSIFKLKHLKSLKLNDLRLLERLPEDIGHLECLEELSLLITNIKHLPDSIYMFKHLKSLKLRLCLLLEKLPENLGLLKHLEELALSCTNVKHLPDSICMLKHLKYLELYHCSLLEKLPHDLGRLEHLEELHLSKAEIKHLPGSICMLKSLKYLKIYDCSLHEKLPEDLGRLGCLEELDLSFTNIKHLPDSICMLKRLKYLKLYHCSLLEKLPQNLGQLERLEVLSLGKCELLKNIPNSICEMKCLTCLHLRDCIRVEKLPEELERLECLEELDIKGTSISHLPHSIILLKGLHIIWFTPARRVSSTVLQG